MSKLAIDVGCGETKVKGSIGVDIRRVHAVDILADVRKLPFKDESVDIVYSNHTIEHFSHTEIKSVLKEWVRVLRVGGIIEISCPDLRIRSLLFFLNPTWGNIKNIYGGQDYDSNYHKCGFSYGILKNFLKACGIVQVRRIIDGYLGIPFLPSCLRVRGVKRKKHTN